MSEDAQRSLSTSAARPLATTTTEPGTDADRLYVIAHRKVELWEPRSTAKTR
jgi:hypothetical protein